LIKKAKANAKKARAVTSAATNDIASSASFAQPQHSSSSSSATAAADLMTTSDTPMGRKADMAEDDAAMCNDASSSSPMPAQAAGPWKVLMSKALQRPFFYNTMTKTGQFAIPSDLMGDEDELPADTYDDMESSPSFHLSSNFDATSAIAEDEEIMGETSPISASSTTDQQQILALTEKASVIELNSRLHEEATSPPPPPALILDTAVDDVSMEEDVVLIDNYGNGLHSQINKDAWVCSACTFINVTLRESCEMCESTNTSYLQSISTQVSPTQTQTQSQSSFFNRQHHSSSAQKKTPKRSTSTSPSSKALKNSGESKKSRIH
jgi:hypothetical protein